MHRCVIKKPRELGGHSPRWAAVPTKKKNTNRILSTTGNISVTHCEQVNEPAKFPSVPIYGLQVSVFARRSEKYLLRLPDIIKGGHLKVFISALAPQMALLHHSPGPEH